MSSAWLFFNQILQYRIRLRNNSVQARPEAMVKLKIQQLEFFANLHLLQSHNIIISERQSATECLCKVESMTEHQLSKSVYSSYFFPSYQLHSSAHISAHFSLLGRCFEHFENAVMSINERYLQSIKL